MSKYWDLSNLNGGDVVVVTLTSWANVQLLTPTDFNAYNAGRQYRYHGGLIKTSPYRLQVPSAGHWHVTVDTRGLRDGTTASIRVLARSNFEPLPEAAPSAHLDAAFRLGSSEGSPPSVPSTSPPAPRPSGQPPSRRAEFEEVFRNAAGLDRPAGVAIAELHDVFISHASEDKDTVARPLADALSDRGVKVWFDETTLRIGDSLRRKIDGGIAHSRFGLVILSKAFLAKGWTNYEFDRIVSMSVDGRQVLLPIWHGVSKDEVLSFSPTLADRVALNTSISTLDEIADELASVILGEFGV